MVGGAAVRPDVCPQPTAGTIVRLVCAFTFPLLGERFTVGDMAHLGYLPTSNLVVLGIWRISWGGSARCTGVGGAGSARLSFGDLLQEGPCGTGGVRPATGRMDPQKHNVGCLLVASKFPGRNWFPLGFWLGDGLGGWHWRAPLFLAKLSSVFRGSTTLPPVVLQSSGSPSR